jgi:hypothetical protein
MDMRAFVLVTTNRENLVCAVHVFHDWYRAQREMNAEWNEAHSDAIYVQNLPEDSITGEVGDDTAYIQYGDEAYRWTIQEDYDYGAL